MKNIFFIFIVLLLSCAKEKSNTDEKTKKKYATQKIIPKIDLSVLETKTIIDDLGLGKLQKKLVSDFDNGIAQAMAKEMQATLDIKQTIEKNGKNYEDSKTLVFVNENTFLKTKTQKIYESLNEQSREQNRIENYKIITITDLGNRFVVLTPQRIQHLKEDNTQRTIRYDSKEVAYYKGNETIKTFNLNQPITGYFYKLVINVLIGEDETNSFISSTESMIEETKYDVEYGSLLIKKYSYEEEPIEE